jgi:hypothetical protein
MAHIKPAAPAPITMRSGVFMTWHYGWEAGFTHAFICKAHRENRDCKRLGINPAASPVLFSCFMAS